MSSPPHICWLQQLYRQYLVEQDVDEFTRRILARYTPATLERLLWAAPNMARRAAALALRRGEASHCRRHGNSRRIGVHGRADG